jgi:molybdopterin-guanine dinucleotide biosynthesis protein A
VTVPAREKPRLEICILAGGLSTRMGRDKARMKIDGVTMLARIRTVAMNANIRLTGYANARKGELQPRVRVLRKDAVPRCGPLGGIVTALRTARAQGVLFLACDMPLITPLLLRRLFRASADGKCATFTAQEQRVGFPLLLPVTDLAVVEEQLAAGEFSLQSLAGKLHARRLLLAARSAELDNVNTAADLARVERELRQRGEHETGKSRNLPAGKPALRRAGRRAGIRVGK